VPIAAWLRGPLRSWARDLLAPGRIQREGFFDAPLLQRCWAEHDAGTHNFGQLLWSVLMFQAWLDEQRVRSP
jgi:asparagine synthase (glutamine-hydrolysing)